MSCNDCDDMNLFSVFLCVCCFLFLAGGIAAYKNHQSVAAHKQWLIDNECQIVKRYATGNRVSGMKAMSREEWATEYQCKDRTYRETN